MQDLGRRAATKSRKQGHSPKAERNVGSKAVKWLNDSDPVDGRKVVRGLKSNRKIEQSMVDKIGGRGMALQLYRTEGRKAV